MNDVVAILPSGKRIMKWHLEVLHALRCLGASSPDDARTKRDVLRKYPDLPSRHWWQLVLCGLCGRCHSAESGRQWEYYILKEGRDILKQFG
jgi:hypothetical protein